MYEYFQDFMYDKSTFVGTIAIFMAFLFCIYIARAVIKEEHKEDEAN